MELSGADLNQVVKDAKLSGPMKDALTDWHRMTNGNAKPLALPAVSNATMGALERRKLVDESSDGWWLSGNGAQIAAHLVDMATEVTPVTSGTAETVALLTAVADYQDTREAIANQAREVAWWLAGYAWMGTDAEKAANIACIMSQDDWQHIDVTAERFEGAQSGDDGEDRMSGDDFALSALYECHDGPHLATCPSVTGYTRKPEAPVTVDMEGFTFTLLHNGVIVRMNDVILDRDGSPFYVWGAQLDSDTGNRMILGGYAGQPIGLVPYVRLPDMSWVASDPTVDVATNELPGDAERTWDAENAAAEGADIRNEQEAEVEFDALLAELFPGDDDPYTTYAECGDQLTVERQGCQACQGEHDVIVPCDEHASVEAWVRAGYREPGCMLPIEPARVTTASPWKISSKGKHKRHGRTRARQVARTRR